MAVVHNNTSASIELREWQKTLTEKLQADWRKGKRHWLVEVAPGGGKTLWSLLIAKMLLDERLIRRVVILCPTIHIRDQWINHHKRQDGSVKFDPIIELTSEKNINGAIENPDDFHGVVLTYAQLASGEGARLQNDACTSPGTLVIADEIHHVGQKRAYGQAFLKAFIHATAQIGLTGTPWTSDGAGPIPYVQYETQGKNQGKVKNDGYQYTRAEAIAGDVLRRMQFFAFDAEVKMRDLDTCVPMEIVQKLSDPETENSDMLDHCLYPGSKWMKSILKEADSRLLGIIHGTDGDEAVPDAKGLITVKSQKFATMVQDQLASITEQPVALIISDNKHAKTELELFKEGKKGRWAVSVNMVSEGVDVPSLFVGIYATNIVSPKFWRQFVGRFERKRHPDERNPIMFFPATETFMGLASSMNAEVQQLLDEWDMPEREKSEGEKEEKEYGRYDTSDAILHSIIEDDKSYHPAQHQECFEICLQLGIPTRETNKMVQGLEILKAKYGLSEQKAAVPPIAPEPSGPRVNRLNNDQVKRELKGDVDKLVKQVAYMRCNIHGDVSVVNEEIRKVSVDLMHRWAPRGKLTIAQLKEARAYLETLKSEIAALQQQFGAR